METDALDELVLPVFSASNLTSNGSILGVTMDPLLLATTGKEEDAVEHGVMKVPLVKVFFLFAYILVFFSCVIGNSMILVVIIANRSMRTVTNFFLANLAVADLLVGIFCVCQNAAHFVVFEHGTWPFGKALCHAYVYILHMIPNSSAGILVNDLLFFITIQSTLALYREWRVLLSVERFIAVLRPMLIHQLMTKSVLILCALLVWIFSALMNLPYVVAVQYIELKNPETLEIYGICTRRFLLWGQLNVLQVVSTVNLFAWYILPLSMLLVIYITIGFVLMRSTEEDAVAQSSHNLRLPVNGNNRRVSEAPKIEVVDSRKRVIRLVVVIVLAFAFFSAPRYMYLTWSVWRDTNSPRCLNCMAALIQPTTFLLMFINSGINPILYAFLSQRFRTAIAETFTCPQKKKERRTKLMMSLHRRRLSEQREHLASSFTNSDMGRNREDSMMSSMLMETTMS